MKVKRQISNRVRLPRCAVNGRKALSCVGELMPKCVEPTTTDADLLSVRDARTCQKPGFKASTNRFSLGEASAGMD